MSITDQIDFPEGAERRPSHSHLYANVIGLVAGAVWAIHPAKLAAIVQVLSMRARGERFTREEIDARLAAARPPVGAEQAATVAAAREQGARGGVAVLRLQGMIAPKQAYFESVSAPNGTSVESFTRRFREAMADPAVGSVLIDVDSPGGIAYMVPELAAEIRGARGTKPIVASANSMAASAAFWLASQADEFVSTPSGDIGSAGVYAAHEDWSVHEEKLGVKTTLVSAGRYKVEANPFEPLSDEARDEIQRRVDEIHEWFLADLARGRRTSVANVRENFGQGRTLSAPAALAAGMIDRVETFDQTVARMLRGQVASRKASAENPFVPIPSAATSAPSTDSVPAVPETVQHDEPGANAAVPVESSHQFAY